MRSFQRGLLLVAVAVASFGCKLGSTADSGAKLAGIATNIHTTYYPYNAQDAQNMGPGHFNCAQYNSEQNWYIAPSDTFGDSRVWQGDPCPYNSSGGVPQCSGIQKTCGVKLKISCAGNCKPNAPAVVVMITDVCPKYHPSNLASGACQGGPAFDIARSVWALMHNANDNIQVNYDVVDSSTPLGPVSGSGSSGASTNSNSNSNTGSGGGTANANQYCDSSGCHPYCTTSNNGDGWGWENNQSCKVGNASSNQTASTGSPSPAPASSGNQWCDAWTKVCYPYCANPNNGWGWENNRSCKVGTGSGNWCDPSSGQCFPYCQTTNNGFGYENGHSCKTTAVASSGASPSSSSPSPSSSSSSSAQWCDPTSKQCFPICVSSNNGNGWGYENGQSCKVGGASSSSSPASAPASTPASSSGSSNWCDPTTFVCYNYCVSSNNGNGWGYENGQSCKVR